MRIAVYFNCLSPHQLPLAYEIISYVGAENFRYIYQDIPSQERMSCGWEASPKNGWMIHEKTEEGQKWLNEVDALLMGIRDIGLLQNRSNSGLKTFYTSERWFKPPLGHIRMLKPSYYSMVKRFVTLVNAGAQIKVLPIGVHALNDMRWIGVHEKNLRLWGYFVSPSRQCAKRCMQFKAGLIRILWVGRLVRLKNVDVILKALKRIDGFCATIVGNGPDEFRLKKMAMRLKITDKVQFVDAVQIDTVRELMAAHDVFVFPSNGYDGWGAVVSEAVEEGMIVLGSQEAGASATVLPSCCQFKCRDVSRLACLLREVRGGKIKPLQEWEWSAKVAARDFMMMSGEK